MDGGPKARAGQSEKAILKVENERLQRENARLQKKLSQAEILLDLPKKSLSALGDPALGVLRDKERIQRLRVLAQEASGEVGIRAARRAMVISRATLYRLCRRKEAPPEDVCAPRGEEASLETGSEHVAVASCYGAHRALSEAEREEVRSTLHSERFREKAPAQVVATLLDEGRYLCSVPTMYRLLRQNGEVNDRRQPRQHGTYQKPEHPATCPNEIWSWDITRLRCPIKWCYYYLYVVLDIFNRYAVGWHVASRDCSEIAKEMILSCFLRQGVVRDRLTLPFRPGTADDQQDDGTVADRPGRGTYTLPAARI